MARHELKPTWPSCSKPTRNMLLAGLHEALVAGHVARREARHLGAHGRRIAGVVEDLAAIEADPIERRHRAQVDIVGQRPAAQRPQLLEQERRGDDGRSGVEREAVLAKHVGPPAGGIELLQHGDAIAARTQTNRRRQPAEAAADHDGMGSLV